jgi:predicted extracellular nuclease
MFLLFVGKRLQNVVILGDFNIYNDFESPIDIITFKPGQTLTGCSQEHREIGSRYISFDDSWQKLYGQDGKGLTFSNMVI